MPFGRRMPSCPTERQSGYQLTSQRRGSLLANFEGTVMLYRGWFMFHCSNFGEARAALQSA
jgi:hypothetical protein